MKTVQATTTCRAWKDIGYYCEAVLSEGGYHVDFTVYELYGELDGQPTFRSLEDRYGTTTNAVESEIHMDGSIKWDGCANLNIGPQGEQPTTHFFHFCGLSEIEKFSKIFPRLYEMAAELMPEHRETIMDRL